MKLLSLITMTPLFLAITACQNMQTAERTQEIIDKLEATQAQIQEIKAREEQQNEAVQMLQDSMKKLPQKNNSDKSANVCNKAMETILSENKSLKNELNKLSLEIRKAHNVAAPTNPKETSHMNKDRSKIDDGKMIFGEQEWVYLAEADTYFESRIDTGASVSSINAINIEKFERDGKTWYSFDIPVDSGNVIHMSAPGVRTAVIRQASSDQTEERPVVRLTVKIGSYTGTNDFTLKDRSKMSFPLLVGREFIKDIAVVDVSRKLVQKKKDGIMSIGAYVASADGTKTRKVTPSTSIKKEETEVIAHLKNDEEEVAQDNASEKTVKAEDKKQASSDTKNSAKDNKSKSEKKDNKADTKKTTSSDKKSSQK